MMKGLTEDAVVKVGIAGLLTAVVRLLFGEWSGLYTAVLVLAGLDFLLGIAGAWKHGNISSDRLRNGVIKILVYLVLLIVGQQVATAVPSLVWMREVVPLYLVLTETISIVENAHALGVPLPNWLIERLRVTRENIKGGC